MGMRYQPVLMKTFAPALFLLALLTAAPALAADPVAAPVVDDCANPGQAAQACEAGCDARYPKAAREKNRAKWASCFGACGEESVARVERCAAKATAAVEADPCAQKALPGYRSCAAACGSGMESLSCTQSCRRTYDSEVKGCKAATP